MIRTTVDKADIQRTIRVHYSHANATPKDCLLDPAWDRSIDIFPGMAMMSKSTAASGAGDVVTLVDATGLPFGLCGVYIAPVYGIDEPRDAGVNAIPVWTMNEGAELEILDPAFDSAATWTFPTDGTALLVHAYTGAGGSDRGVLAPAGAANVTAKPIARAISRPAANRLIIAGLGKSGAY